MIRADGHPGSAVPNGLSLQSAAPVLLFLAVNRVAGLRWAVAIATAGSIALALDRRRKGLPLGRLMPLVTGAVIARGAIGVITGSETVYFGLGIAYFSDETGSKAGYLLPSDSGWEEFDQPIAGPAILEAISFYNRTAQKQATFVDLFFKTN